MMKEFRGTLAY